LQMAESLRIADGPITYVCRWPNNLRFQMAESLTFADGRIT
jgi:hypothetical protein